MFVVFVAMLVADPNQNPQSDLQIAREKHTFPGCPAFPGEPDGGGPLSSCWLTQSSGPARCWRTQGGC